MPSYQMSCPYCGSLLSFTQPIPPGTAIPCLICNRPFAAPALAPTPAAAPPPARPPAAAPPTMQAPRPVVSPPPAAAPVPVPPKAPAPVPAAKLPTPVAATPAAPTAKVPAPRALPARQPASSGGLTPSLIGGVALAGLALLLLAGLVYLFWANVLASRPDAGKSAAVAKGPETSSEPDKKVPQPPKVEPNPQAPSGTKEGKKEGTSPPPNVPEPKAPDPKAPEKGPEPGKGGGDVEVADLKKPEKPGPAPAPVAPINKPDPDVKLPPAAPEIQVTIPTGPANAAGVDAKRIEAAIAQGIAYLKKQQNAEGTWNASLERPLGYAALGGLTLLECKVPANDPAVTKAAQFVRAHAPKANATYDLAVSILFLDRLGDARDKGLIQGLGMQMVGGQGPTGAWGYTCSPRAGGTLQEMFTFLKGKTPKTLPAAAKPPGDPGKFAGPFAGKEGGPGPFGGPQITLGPELAWNRWNITPLEKFTPVDNSNTQFAILALWVARRHDVPADWPLVCTYWYLLSTQSADGGWGYRFPQPTSNTMTCAGLLGLAIGRGAVPGAAKTKLEDPAIDRALTTLGHHVGSPSADPNAKLAMENTYFLWSVERVAMLYDLKTIGGKDWYGWGAQILLANQQLAPPGTQLPGGYWTGGNYTGATDHTDTCFALLFLNRSNLVHDLTQNLKLYMVIRDPAAQK